MLIFNIRCSYVRSTEDISYVSTEPNALALNRTSSNGTRYRSKSKRNEVSGFHSFLIIGLTGITSNFVRSLLQTSASLQKKVGINCFKFYFNTFVVYVFK